MHSQLPLEAEIFLEDRTRGVTPTVPHEWLELQSTSLGPVSWYAFLWNARVAKGTALGGDFDILVDEKSNTVESRPSDYFLEEGNPPPRPRL